MTIMFYEAIEATENNVGDTWYEVASKSGDLDVGQYFIWIYTEYRGQLTDQTAHIRFLVDGIERGHDYHIPEVSGEYKAFSVFGLLNVTVFGNHTVSVEIKGGSATQTVGVRRRRLTVMKE